MRYARDHARRPRAAPSRSAASRPANATRAHITYELTGLADPVTVDHFAEDFPAMLAEWERLIAASLA